MYICTYIQHAPKNCICQGMLLKINCFTLFAPVPVQKCNSVLIGWNITGILHFQGCIKSTVTFNRNTILLLLQQLLHNNNSIINNKIIIIIITVFQRVNQAESTCGFETESPFCTSIFEIWPLQNWIAAVCVLHICCVQRNTHAECTCAKLHTFIQNTCCLHLFCMCAYCNSAHFILCTDSHTYK